jgi:hypothetical protein
LRGRGGLALSVAAAPFSTSCLVNVDFSSALLLLVGLPAKFLHAQQLQYLLER